MNKDKDRDKDRNIMKRIEQLCRIMPLIGIGLCLTMGSCNTPEEADTMSSRPVALGIGSIGMPEQPESRATVTKGSIGIYVAANTWYSKLENQEGTYNTGTGKWSPTSAVWLNDKDATLVLVWPRQASASFALTAKEWTASEDIFAGARSDVNNRNGDNLTFSNLKPVYARLQITVNKKNTYSGPGNWTKLVLSGADLYQSGTYNPLPDNVTGQSGAGYTQNFSTAKGIDGEKIDLRLLPVASLTQDLKVVMTVDGKDMSVTVPKERFNNTKMERGVYYTLTITVSTVGLSITSLDYTEWANNSTETSAGTSQTN